VNDSIIDTEVLCHAAPLTTTHLRTPQAWLAAIWAKKARLSSVLSDLPFEQLL
jgi:hypothetical protein